MTMNYGVVLTLESAVEST